MYQQRGTTVPYINVTNKFSNYFRFARESYGDSAVGYVQLKKNGNFCTIKGLICAEHEDQEYNVMVLVDEAEKRIISSECHVCSESGICIHVVAFILWLHRRSERVTTSIECYWKSPTQKKIGSAEQIICTRNVNEISSSQNNINLSTSASNSLEEYLKAAGTTDLLKVKPSAELD